MSRGHLSSWPLAEQSGTAFPLLCHASLLGPLLPVGLCLALQRTELPYSSEGVICWQCLPGVGGGFRLGPWEKIKAEHEVQSTLGCSYLVSSPSLWMGA